jgi:hypothetical protein
MSSKIPYLCTLKKAALPDFLHGKGLLLGEKYKKIEARKG